jgi:hypothetical protein
VPYLYFYDHGNPVTPPDNSYSRGLMQVAIGSKIDQRDSLLKESHHV